MHKKLDEATYIARRPLIIGLIGKKKSGKSTAAKYLVDNHNFKEFAFADSLKRACMEIFNLEYGQLYDQNKKEIIDPYWKLTPREIMQDFGTAIRNMAAINENYSHRWIKSVERQLDCAINQEINQFNEYHPLTNYVISDVRYQDEADMILRKGGILIKIIRPQSTASYQSGPATSQRNINRIDGHESENQDIYAPHIIYNDGGLIALYKKIDDALNRIQDTTYTAPMLAPKTMSQPA